MDVGLPTQTSIFISTSGFYKPAVDRAGEVGMKTLILDLKNKRNTEKALLKAVQTKIFILCSVSQISMTTKEKIPYENMKFFTSKKEYFAALPDFLWEIWMRGDIPLKCGEYEYSISISEKIKYLENGEKNSINDLKATFKVSALVYIEKSKAYLYGLINAKTGAKEKLTVKFDFSNDDSTQIPIHVYEEETLQKLTSDAEFKILFSKIQLPKISLNYGLLWPPSDDMIEYMKKFTTKSEISPEDILVGPNDFWEFNETCKGNLSNFLKYRMGEKNHNKANSRAQVNPNRWDSTKEVDET